MAYLLYLFQFTVLCLWIWGFCKLLRKGGRKLFLWKQPTKKALKWTGFSLVFLPLYLLNPEVKLRSTTVTKLIDGGVKVSGELLFDYQVFSKEHHYSYMEGTDSVSVSAERVLAEKWYSPDYVLRINYLGTAGSVFGTFLILYFIAASIEDEPAEKDSQRAYYD